MKILLWEVCLLRAPAVVRYCKRCERKTEFVSSGLFRVNAQQKNLDIWLVYKCRACDTTWNLTVLSRVNPQSIAHDLLERYMSNDYELAMKHAADSALIKQTGAKCNIADVCVVGQDYFWDEPVKIRLTSKWSPENKISSIIRQKLNISGNSFSKLLVECKITCLSGHNLKKSKMNDAIILQITP